MNKEKRLILRLFKWFVKFELSMFYNRKPIDYKGMRYIRRRIEKIIIDEGVSDTYELYKIREDMEDEMLKEWEGEM